MISSSNMCIFRCWVFSSCLITVTLHQFIQTLLRWDKYIFQKNKYPKKTKQGSNRWSAFHFTQQINLDSTICVQWRFTVDSVDLWSLQGTWFRWGIYWSVSAVWQMGCHGCSSACQSSRWLYSPHCLLALNSLLAGLWLILSVSVWSASSVTCEEYSSTGRRTRSLSVKQLWLDTQPSVKANNWMVCILRRTD